MLSSLLKFPFLNTKAGKYMAILLTTIFFATIALDQISKYHAHNTLLTWQHEEDIRIFRSTFVDVMQLGEDKSALDENSFYFRFKFHYQRNTGAAFSMFANVDDAFRVPFFYMVTLIAVLFIGYYLKTLPRNFHLTRFGLVMILAGAIGNFIDRILLGYVIDFLDVEWVLWKWHHDFAVFNIADVAINIGIISFILESLLPIKAYIYDESGELKLLKKAKS